MKESTIRNTVTLITILLLLISTLILNHHNQELMDINDKLITQAERSEKINKKRIELLEKQSDILNNQLEVITDIKNNYRRLYRELSRNFNESNYSLDSIILLAKCAKAEAGDFENHAKAQQLVVRTILNRVEDEEFPNTLKEVIYQKRGKIPQFSVAYDGAIERVELDSKTLLNVYNAVLYNTYKVPSNVLYFYSSSLKENNWVKSRKTYSVTQGTVFCYETER